MAAIPSSVQTLIDAARARLWFEAGRRMAQRAAWASAGAMVLVSAAHLAPLGVPVVAAPMLVGLIWLAMAAWAVGLRPTDGAAALWIDRHLGGASAFTTLLDVSSNAHRPVEPQALSHLARFASARVPEAERLLATRRSATRIAPALLSMAVCTGLALFVLALPDGASSRVGQASASASIAVDASQASTPAPDRPAATQVASDLSNALRSSESPPEPGRRSGEAQASSSSARSAEASLRRAEPAGASNEATAAAGSLQPSEKVSGRGAGESRDERADVGVSRNAGGSMVVTRTGTTAASALDRQADMTRVAGFEASSADAGGRFARGALGAAAAMPPPATDAARLSPAETHYVQAWMKASGRNP